MPSRRDPVDRIERRPKGNAPPSHRLANLLQTAGCGYRVDTKVGRSLHGRLEHQAPFTPLYQTLEVAMSSALPRNPLEVFPATPATREAVRKASIFGWWDFPMDDIGVDGAEFNDNDTAYWHFTSGNPVTRTTRQVSDAIFKDCSALGLPAEFKAQQFVTLGAAGDLIQAEGLQQSKDALFEGIEDVLFNSDLAFANYESVVVDSQTAKQFAVDGSSFIMCCDEAQYQALTTHKGRHFDIVNVANNHSLDLGGGALSATQALLDRDGIISIGAPRNAGDYGKGTIVSRNGIRLGFVSVTFSLNDMPLPEDEPFRVHRSKLMSRFVPTDLELLRKQIEDCKRQGCDFIVASIHWGVEFEFFPRMRQVEAAHTLIEDGVDLILGHHPHVIQPVEYYRTKRDPDRVAVIAYSMGSLTWGWFTAPHLILSLVMNFNIVKGSVKGEIKTYIKSVEIIPAFRNISLEERKRLMRIEKLSERLQVREDDPDIATMRRYVELTMGGTCWT